jgi:aerobic-type carbon monoxide dehydrogenase small subunit (CoxS/CutS family)/CO/xanthine dehydrogenase FAD-binding subunit
MLARGIRSYHRPGRLEEALSLAGQGAIPIAGGTRMLASPAELPNLLDLSALGLAGLHVDDGDLVLGPLATLQEVADSTLAHETTSGLLPAACHARSVSRMLRSMATVGGEAVHGAPDSELVAALLALNAIFTVTGPAASDEIPALRFLKDPREDLAGGRLVTSIRIPGAPDGAALERVAPIPSAPALLAVAVAVSFSGPQCARARIALCGLDGRPARLVDAEARIEGTSCGEEALEACAERVRRASFRDDAHAPAGYRKQVAPALVARAVRSAAQRARAQAATTPARARPTPPTRATGSLPYFTSGRVDLSVNGSPVHAEAEARTSLLELLRRTGHWGVKHGCETGECGACAVLLDGRPVCSCMTLALRAEGRSVLTVEGLGTPERLHPIQAAFVETGAIQCGFCTPAMELCAKALLDAVPDPTAAEVRDALAGSLCRCTGYVKPVEAVMRAAQALRESQALRAGAKPKGQAG